MPPMKTLNVHGWHFFGLPCIFVALLPRLSGTNFHYFDVVQFDSYKVFFIYIFIDYYYFCIFARVFAFVYFCHFN